MVVCNLTGGIGNQLFQYAMAKSVALRGKTELFFDIRSFQWDELRTFKLDQLGLDYKIVSNEMVEFLKSNPLSYYQRFKKQLGISEPYYKHSYIKELSFQFDDNFKKFRSKNVYLEGYWQSEKYFESIRLHILTEIQFGLSSYISGKYLANILQEKESVSIHVRRGDYAHNPETASYHGLMNFDYYKKAIDLIKTKLNQAYFFVFSDDKAYVKELFGDFNNLVIVEECERDIDDLCLMSKCKHQIIANSSFSWWGAWLNQNQNKIVISPNQWFNDVSMQLQTKDLIPSRWIKI
jgi:hypothetical protein